MATRSRRLVAGVDSSTQACKVVVRDAETGELVRAGRAGHPPGTEVDPDGWWHALGRALGEAGGLDDVAALAVAAQQHGLVCLDEDGATVRRALLWNDTRSAGAAADLVAELGAERWAAEVGSVPLASFTVAKLRWLAEHEPGDAGRVAAACLPHDWLTWKLAGSGDVGALTTDRGDASGTGYWSPAEGCYRPDLVARAFGRQIGLPQVLGASEPVTVLPEGGVLAPGTGDNMAAALGLGARPGDRVVSVGTSGVVSAVSEVPTADPTGCVAGFADATGRYLPLVCTLNAAPVLATTAALLGVDLDRFADLACAAPPGAGGLVLVPYLDGERTPDLPHATGSLFGLRHANATPSDLARAAVEGVLCGLRDGLEALGGIPDSGRLVLVGGGARSRAVREVAPAVFGRPVLVPAPGDHVADGAARQAAWVLLGGDEPPPWPGERWERCAAPATPAVTEAYAACAAAVREGLGGEDPRPTTGA